MVDVAEGSAGEDSRGLDEYAEGNAGKHPKKVHTYRALRDNIKQVRIISWLIWLGLLIQCITAWVMYGLGHGKIVLVYAIIVTIAMVLNLKTLGLLDRTLDQPDSPFIVFAQVFIDGVYCSFFYWVTLVSFALYEDNRSLAQILANAEAGHRTILWLLGVFLVVSVITEIACLLRSSFLLEFRGPSGINTQSDDLRLLAGTTLIVRVFVVALIVLIGYSAHVTNNAGLVFTAVLLFAVTAIQIGHQLCRKNSDKNSEKDALAEYCFAGSQHALVTLNCVMSTILLIVLQSMNTSLHELFSERSNNAIIPATLFLSLGIILVLAGESHVSFTLHRKHPIDEGLLGLEQPGAATRAPSCGSRGSIQADSTNET
eukprot:gb/GECG01005991.1/.p1 GENE.gb/GECG01005991.1/~~gb/GECG01005991.1/.p1  ORF type:complete len:371 (+),score=19.02 gb/GECG01005991.1/:1-1113(+)